MRETLAAFVDADRSANVQDLVERLKMQHGLPFWQDYLRRTFELMRVQPGQRVLDIGCGTGNAVRELAARIRPDGQSIGLDASRQLVVVAESDVGNADLPVRFIHAPAERMPLEDASIDGARADRVFMYLKDMAMATREAMRVLKPGGMLVVSEPDMEGTWLDCGDVELARKITRASATAVPNSGAARGLRALFLQTGFVDVTVEARPLLMTSFEQMDKISSYRALTDEAMRRGDMTAQEVERWFDAMLTRDRAGRALGGTTFFIVSGRKPAAG